jgi:hypothetical protein
LLHCPNSCACCTNTCAAVAYDNALPPQAFSIAGIYVSHIGLKATRTVDREDVKRYVLLLCSLAACVILGRVVWVVNMILQAKIQIRKVIAKEEEDAANEDAAGGKGDPSVGTDDVYGDGTSSRHLDPSTMLFYFGVQVVIMALIYSTMWAFCVTLALRFRNAVEEESSDRSQAPTTV